MTSRGPLPASVGEFVYPRCYSRFRQLTFPVADSIVCLSVMDTITTAILDDWAERQPQTLVDVTQQITRDVWSSIRHLSVSADDLWVRLGRGYELLNTSFRETVLAEDVILMIVIAAAGRCDKPVISSSLSSSCKSYSFLKNTSLMLAKLFSRQPQSFQLQLQHSNVTLGSQMVPTDTAFFAGLRYSTVARDLESLHENNNNNNSNGPYGSDNNNNSKKRSKGLLHIDVDMDDIRLFLYPPQPEVRRPTTLPPALPVPLEVKQLPVRPLVTTPVRPLMLPRQQASYNNYNYNSGGATTMRPTVQGRGEWEPSIAREEDHSVLHIANQQNEQGGEEEELNGRRDDGHYYAANSGQSVWRQRQATVPY